MQALLCTLGLVCFVLCETCAVSCVGLDVICLSACTLGMLCTATCSGTVVPRVATATLLSRGLYNAPAAAFLALFLIPHED